MVKECVVLGTNSPHVGMEVDLVKVEVIAKLPLPNYESCGGLFRACWILDEVC